MSLTDQPKAIISKKFNSIKYGIDATCGNGNDTLFLAKLCSKDGIIYSFDIQEKALSNAHNLIKKHNLSSKVQFIRSGHEYMNEFVTDKVDIIMFNLGYLPSFNRKIYTLSGTTITALNSSCRLLKNNGMISIICYPGHESGKKETKEVKKWIKSINKNIFTVTEYLSENSDSSTPILYILEN
ncbi:MAG: methyltransferase domain-containing protein [Candidatus Dadabacteria bacterium]|nr:methyltransferase domain-containing protein [Candidatus Dadabacteria bacterium]NIQ16363.1 methyltransferase domain-containing protein [Candidatus Dadabacteria bacterium]